MTGPPANPWPKGANTIGTISPTARTQRVKIKSESISALHFILQARRVFAPSLVRPKDAVSEVENKLHKQVFGVGVMVRPVSLQLVAVLLSSVSDPG